MESKWTKMLSRFGFSGLVVAIALWVLTGCNEEAGVTEVETNASGFQPIDSIVLDLYTMDIARSKFSQNTIYKFTDAGYMLINKNDLNSFIIDTNGNYLYYPYSKPFKGYVGYIYTDSSYICTDSKIPDEPLRILYTYESQSNGNSKITCFDSSKELLKIDYLTVKSQSRNVPSVIFKKGYGFLLLAHRDHGKFKIYLF